MQEKHPAPRTPLTTEFRGGPRAVQERLCSLFTGVKRRGPAGGLDPGPRAAGRRTGGLHLLRPHQKHFRRARSGL